MIILTAFSGLLFVVPIIVTFGVYFGVEHERILRCGLSCDDSTGNGNSNGTSGGNTNSSTTSNPWYTKKALYCEKSLGIPTPSEQYIFNPNQWGDTEDEGFLCINFTRGFNESDGFTPAFAATWQYSQGPDTEPVHAFANAELNASSILPIQLSSMSGLTMDVQWSYNVDNELSNTSDWDALANHSVNADVVLDLFLATEGGNSFNATDAQFEVMVWLGQLGAYTLPLGYANGSVDTREVNGATFDLYTGANTYGQNVLTWLAQGNTTTFYGDVGPLVQDLGNYTGPSSSDYLVYVAFGTEALYADANATFYVPTLKLDVLSS